MKKDTFQDYNSYRDRGMMKWGAFMLSEHSERKQKDESARGRRFLPKEKMDADAIADIVGMAIRKNKPVMIQLEQTDAEGEYLPDVTGRIFGGEDDLLFVGELKVSVESIRNIQLSDSQKWHGL